MSLGQDEEFAGFTVVRLLGAGGMGEVYLVKHPRLPRVDALKVLSNRVSSDEEFRERFLREAEMAAGLGHPHIVGVHDRGETEDGTLWVSMEYVEGVDAGNYLTSSYPDGMPLWMVNEIITAIASALDYAHAQRLLHRDVKPANILLGSLGEGQYRVMLTDFGIARQIDDNKRLTATNMTVGTVNYTSPEQLVAGDLDGRSDQYSLAATAYHLLTGRPLFDDSNAAVVIGSHLSAEPPPVSSFRPELAEQDAVVARGLAKEPAARYPSCTAFARALAGLPEQSDRFTAASAVVTASGPLVRPTGMAGRHRRADDVGEDDDGYWDAAASHPTMMAPAAAPRSSNRALWAALIAVPLIVASTVFLVLYLIGQGPWAPEPTSAEASSVSTATAAASPAVPTPPTEPNAWTGVVAVVCDAGAACELQQRNAPFTDAPRLQPEGLPNGAVVTLACHENGDERTNPGHGTSRLWYRLTNGAYVNSVFLDNVRATGMDAC